jgi:hypothetical protein
VVLAALADATEKRELALEQKTRCSLGEQKTNTERTPRQYFRFACGDGASRATLRMLQPDRPYERMNITGLTGVNEVQRAALKALGAVERSDPSAPLYQQ